MSTGVVAHATAATTPLTRSSGATATLAGEPGMVIYLQKVIILQGSSLLTLSNDMSLSGLLVGDIVVPFSQLAASASQIELDFSSAISIGLPGAPGAAVSLSIPALLGGAESTLILIGEYA